MASDRTAYTYDSRFLLHDTGVDEVRLPNGEVLDPEPHPSSVRITRRTAQLIEKSGLLRDVDQVPARSATVDEITRFHDASYVEEVRKLTSEGGGELHRNTPVVRGTWDAALLSAGTSIALTRAVVEGQARNAFGLVRPPGHHATADEGMGYCVFNNAVLGALHARDSGIGRVVVIDWDVHHGNGIQSAFWDDPDALFVSLHQDNWFPGGSGTIEEVGGGDAEGTTVNVALPPGTGDRGYERAFERIVEPILRSFNPGLILVSSGTDASMMDPLGRMIVTSAGFREIATRTRVLADELCEGRLVVLQEGGYSAGYAPFCSLAVLEGLVGTRTEVEDPLAGDSELAQAMVELRDEQEQAIDRVRAVHSRYWEL